MRSTFGKLSVMLATLLFAYVGQTAFVAAANDRVTAACMNDYFTFCSEHDPEGKAVRRCMNRNGPRLSKPCLNALVAAGEVSKKEVARRLRNAR